MSAVNLWKRSQLQRELRDAGLNEKWRFVGIVENGVGHCFKSSKICNFIHAFQQNPRIFC